MRDDTAALNREGITPKHAWKTTRWGGGSVLFPERTGEYTVIEQCFCMVEHLDIVGWQALVSKEGIWQACENGFATETDAKIWAETQAQMVAFRIRWKLTPRGYPPPSRFVELWNLTPTFGVEAHWESR